jgi:hypothetical protein
VIIVFGGTDKQGKSGPWSRRAARSGIAAAQWWAVETRRRVHRGRVKQASEAPAARGRPSRLQKNQKQNSSSPSSTGSRAMCASCSRRLIAASRFYFATCLSLPVQRVALFSPAWQTWPSLRQGLSASAPRRAWRKAKRNLVTPALKSLRRNIVLRRRPRAELAPVLRWLTRRKIVHHAAVLGTLS